MLKELYRKLLEFTRDGVYRYRFRDGKILLANQGLVNILGLDSSPDDLVGKRLKEVMIYTEKEGSVREELEEKGEIHRFEYHFKTLAGVDKWVLHDSFMTVDPGSGEKIVEAIVKDITFRKEAEQALNREKERLAVTLRSIGDAVIATDKEEKVVLFNPIAETLTGWTEKEVLGRPLPEVFHIIDQATGRSSRDPVAQVLSSDQPVDLSNNTVLIARNGDRRIISDSAAPIHDSGGRMIGVVLVFRDVTEKQRLEEQLLRAQKLEALGTLAGGLAHDFNNILVGIVGNLSIIRERLPSGSSYEKQLKSAEKAADRAAGLVRQMLAYSGKGRFMIEPIDLSAQVRDIAELFRASIPKNVELKFELRDGLPTVEADASQFQQLAMNLILNAVEACLSPKSSIVISTGEAELSEKDLDDFTARSEGMEAGSYVFLAVRDNGEGMDSQTVRRMFDPFYTTKTTGRGLGLAAALGIIKSHKGGIRVESSPGEGTVIKVFLPTTARPLPAEGPERGKISLSGRGTVLVVDDEEIVREVVEEMLIGADYQVLTAESGDEAVDVFRENQGRISAVILDLSMPGKGGMATFREIHSISPHTPVILSSGYDREETMRDFSGQGLAGFIQKPFKAKVLKSRLSEVLAAASSDSTDSM